MQSIPKSIHHTISTLACLALAGTLLACSNNNSSSSNNNNGGGTKDTPTITFEATTDPVKLYAGVSGGTFTNNVNVDTNGKCTVLPTLSYSAIDKSTEETADTSKIALSDATPGEVTYKAAGTYTITASTKATTGDSTCDAADAFYTLKVNKATPTLVFTANSVDVSTGTSVRKLVGLYGVGNDSTSSGRLDNVPVTYSSDDTSIATVNPTTGEVTAALLDGTADVFIRASYAGSHNYTDATAGYTLRIRSTQPTIGFTDASADATYAGAAGGKYTRAASVTPSGVCTTIPGVTYGISGDTNSPTVDASGEVTYTAVGTYTITASTKLAPGCAAASKSYDLTVNKATPTIEFINPVTTTVTVGATITNLAKLSGVGGGSIREDGRTLDGKSITYSSTDTAKASADTAKASVDANTGTVTGKLRSSTGGVTITATYPGSANYNPTSDQYQLTVTLVPAELTSAKGSPIKKFIFSWQDVADAAYYKLWEIHDGGMNTRVGGDILQGAQSITSIVPLFASAYTRYRLESCDNAYVCAVSPNDLVITKEQLNRAIGYIKANNTGKNDYFGTSVSLSGYGTTLAVGAYEEGSDATGVGNNPGEWTDMSNDAAHFAGAVYVFTRDTTGDWTQQAYIKASNTNYMDNFGWSLSLSADGTTLAVGAWGEDSDATGIGSDQPSGRPDFPHYGDSGAVYVFTRNATTKDWTQDAYVKASNTGHRDEFGRSLSLSADGTTLAVGAPYERSNATGVGNYPIEWDRMDNNDTTNAGAVYVFSRTNSTSNTSNKWIQQAYIKASNIHRTDLFGWSTSLSVDGDTLAVGATTQGRWGGGAVYIFTRDTPGGWSEQAYIQASNENQEDEFGHAVSLSPDGTTLAVGAPYEDSNATGVGNDQSQWDTMDNDNTRRESGAVYMFSRTNSTSSDWTQDAYIKASNTGEKAEFGYSLSFDANGDILAVGAKGEGSNATGVGVDGDQSDNTRRESGAVYLFTRNATTKDWTQQAYIKASNTDVEDWFGTSLSLSADGTTLAVGAIGEGSNATGIDGDGQANNSTESAGAVYLY